MITINITSPRQIEGIKAAAAAVGENAELYIQRIVELAAESYRDQFYVDRITTSDFIFRFTDEEKNAILASTDELVIGFMNKIKSEPYVWLASTEVVDGLGYLVSLNLLTQERSDEITNYIVSEESIIPEEPIPEI